METSKRKSGEARRDRTGGIVRDKLDLLMDDTRREAVPSHLTRLAEELQAAIDDKTARNPG
jgi:Mor family transcriptional regulator